MGNRPPCVTVSYGIPNNSATSLSLGKCNVVHADPKPLSRKASMKLQTAGSSDPHALACPNVGTPVSNLPAPWMQGIIMTGTS